MIVGCTSKSLSLPVAVTPTEPSGTVITDDGQSLVLSHPNFYWTLKLPRDWVITADTGFEVRANSPAKTAFMHLLSEQWENPSERPSTSRNYVDTWKTSILGDMFPPYASGDQISETEISTDKFGGPYLRYEFDDTQNGIRYLQVYSSAGGPNSIVLTVWAKNTDYSGVQADLESILNSVALLEE
jgi:hypothetical protein